MAVRFPRLANQALGAKSLCCDAMTERISSNAPMKNGGKHESR
jgi:hypothetical protein